MALASQLRSRVPLGAKHAFADVACSDLAGKITGTVLRYRIKNQGLVFDTRDPAFLPSVRAGLFWGMHERDEIRFIREHFKDEPLVVELGSSLGVTGSHVLSVMKPDGRYIGVEANPDLMHALRATLEDHRQEQLVAVVNAAISDARGTAKFTIADEPTGSLLASDPEERGDCVDVTTLRLGDLLREQGVEGPFALVADIEGAERCFILGDDEALSECSRLVIELHDSPEATVAELVAALVERHGFQVLERRGVVLALAR